MLDLLKFQILQVIMATNRIETLDPALIRPGKCCLADGMNLCVWGGGVARPGNVTTPPPVISNAGQNHV
jgi:hypothetical protein